jgi:flagellar motor component MotA
MPPMDEPAGPGVKTALAMRKFFERHRRALQTAWDLAPNATIVATAISMVAMLQDIER